EIRYGGEKRGDGLPGFEAVQGGNQRQRATGLVKLESFRNERSHDRASTMPHMIPAPGTFAAGVAIFLIVLWDAFESIILPRRVTRRFRLTRVFYKFTWRTWKFLTQLIPSRKKRETLLSFYGPLSLLVLVGVWAVGLVLGFGMMQYGAGSAVNMTGGQPGFATDVYLSGTTFFTLGLGDVVPQTGLARVLVVTEAGFGFGFLGAVIGYLPFIYGSFSKREVNISLLDARAGTPPTAGELLRRHAYPGGGVDIRDRPARGGRSFAGFQDATTRAAAQSPTCRGSEADSRHARAIRPETGGHRGNGRPARGPAENVRALSFCAGGIFGPVSSAVDSCRERERQLADYGVGPLGRIGRKRRGAHRRG